jgi:anti-anti-sigma regulatory factor
MARKGKKRIGFDPLAWMKSDSTPTPSDEPSDSVTEGAPVAELEPSPEAPVANSPGATDASVDQVRPQLHASTADDRGQINSLGSALTIVNAEELRKRLEAILDSAVDGLSLDAGDLESVDTAGLQLLCVFAQQAKTRGIVVTWRNAPEVLIQGAVRLDLEKILRVSPDSANA